jgi:hypothetical protein
MRSSLERVANGKLTPAPSCKPFVFNDLQPKNDFATAHFLWQSGKVGCYRAGFLALQVGNLVVPWETSCRA